MYEKGVGLYKGFYVTVYSPSYGKRRASHIEEVTEPERLCFWKLLSYHLKTVRHDVFQLGVHA